MVFVKVRQRASRVWRGGCQRRIKRRRIIFAARQYLMCWRRLPPARFDVVLVERDGVGEGLQWLQAAFDGGGV